VDAASPRRERQRAWKKKEREGDGIIIMATQLPDGGGAYDSVA